MAVFADSPPVVELQCLSQPSMDEAWLWAQGQNLSLDFGVTIHSAWLLRPVLRWAVLDPHSGATLLGVDTHQSHLFWPYLARGQYHFRLQAHLKLPPGRYAMHASVSEADALTPPQVQAWVEVQANPASRAEPPLATQWLAGSAHLPSEAGPLPCTVHGAARAYQACRLFVADILALLLIPAFAALWPDRWAQAWLRWAARWSGLFQYEVEQARLGAQCLPALAQAEPDQAWQQQQRWIRLNDGRELFRALFGARALPLQLQGTWPEQTCLWVGCHWGAQYALFPHLAARKQAAWFLARGLKCQDFAALIWRLPLTQLKNHWIAHTGSRGCLFTGGSMAQMRDKLSQGQNVVALADVPSRFLPHRAEVQVGPHRAWLPTGLLTVAQQAQVPVILFALHIDAQGQRQLRLAPAFWVQNPEQDSQRVADWLTECLSQAPAHWHLWASTPYFWQRPEP